MFSKSRILVLFLALCIFAAPETVTQQSRPFVFTQGVGVINQKFYTMTGASFSYKKIAAIRGTMSFSWSLPMVKADKGSLSIFTISGKLIKSFDVTSREGNINWSMPHGKMASGVYFASLAYGQYKKNIRILF